MSRKNLIIIITFVVLAAAITVFFVFRDDIAKPTTPEVAAPPAPQEITQPAPMDELMALKNAALERKIPTGDEAIVKELKDLSSQLKSEPNYLQGWLQVGILRKFLGDYEGAALAWQYAALIRPNDFIVFSNLGDLYHYYLKDFPKAEKYLRRAVDIKPDYVAGYKNLFDLYTLSYKEKENLAEAVLLEGMQKNPNDQYLRTILTSYKNDNQR